MPVLSEQMYETEPRVSTAGSFLIRAFCLTMFFAPMARAIVITAGNASGIAATARLMAVKSISATGSPLISPATNTMAHMTRIAMASLLPKTASRC